MLRNTLLIFAVICFSEATDYAHVPTSLENTLTLATKFFQKLKKDYESFSPSKNGTTEIDAVIVRYMEELKKPIYQSRHRRQLNENDDNDINGIKVVNGFEEVPGSNLSAALDVAFFISRYGAELQWLAATLDSSQISLLRFNGNEFIKVTSYPLSDGTIIAADSSKSGIAIVVVGRSDGSVIILRLRQKNQTTIFHLAQNLNVPGSSLHLTFWRGMNELYLGLASTTSVVIYKWLGEHFDRVQSLDSGAKGLTPFKTGGSIYLAATAARTMILKFVLHSNEFVVVQQLPSAEDVTSFHLQKGHQREHYLVLSNENLTVLYKLAHDRFVPFQSIDGADKVTSMATEKTVVLTLLKGTTVVVYQYDGWKFVKLTVTMSDVERIYSASLEREIVLVTKYTKGGWKFNRLTMTRKSNWKTLREGVKSLCFEIKDQQKRLPPVVPPLKGPVKILNGHIGKLHTHMVNGYNSDGLTALTSRYKTLLQSTLALTKQSAPLLTPKTSPKFKILHGKSVKVKCASQCKANKVVTIGNEDFMDNLVTTNNGKNNQKLEFSNVRIQSDSGSLPCPVPVFALQEVTVSGYVNGISIQELQDETLRISGDQEVRGEHIFANLNASSGLLPLGIASQTSQQRVHASSIRVHDLQLTQGDYLLPLDGPPVSVSGPKTVARAKITGLVELRAGIKGKGIARLAPLTQVSQGLLELEGSYSFEDVDVMNTLTTDDLMRREGKSLKEIANAALPLNGNVPSHLILSADKVAWTNVTIRHLPKWVTLLPMHNKDIINITGVKYTPHNLTLTTTSYDNLPSLRLHGKICAEEATMPDILTTGITLDRSTVHSIRSEHVWGATVLNNTISDTVLISQNLVMASKNFVGKLEAKNASFTEISGIDFEGLLESMVKWIEPGFVKGSLEASNLTTTNLFSRNSFRPALTGEAKELTSKVNLYVGTINNVNVSDFITNVVRLDDTVSLTDINFAGGVVAKEIHVSQSPVNFSLQQETGFYMGSKTIIGSLQTKKLVVPEELVPRLPQQSANFIVQGSAVFAREPMVESVNGKRLVEISEKTWLMDKPTVLSNGLFEIRNMVLDGPVQLLSDSPNSPTRGSWVEMPRYLLSKTKPQEINSYVSLSVAKTPNVIGNGESTLTTPSSFFGGPEMNFLKKHEAQRVTTSVRFSELRIPGDLDARNTINQLNLTTEVVRNDVEKNIVTGKKSIASISAQDVQGGLNFAQWSRKALRSRNGDEPIIIEGRKLFRNITLQQLRVHGTIMGRKIEDCLLKSSQQRITGSKTIEGCLTAPKLVMDGLINDVALTSLVKHQLKKNETVQTVRTGVILRGDFQILGDLTIEGLYRGVELKNLSRIRMSFQPVVDEMTMLLDIAEWLDLALRNRAHYFGKLEEVENPTALNGLLLPTNSTKITSSLGHCEFREGSLFCDDAGVHAAALLPESSEALLCKVVTLKGRPLVVLATSDPHGGAWIYTFDTVKKEFHKEFGLYFYGATQASVVVSFEALWLAVQLPHNTVILRYESWGEYKEYTLPGSGSFHMDTEPAGQLLIIRSDGVWSLGGVEGPHNIFRTLLDGVVDTLAYEKSYFVRIKKSNSTSLLKARYVGN